MVAYGQTQIQLGITNYPSMTLKSGLDRFGYSTSEILYERRYNNVLRAQTLSWVLYQHQQEYFVNLFSHGMEISECNVADIDVITVPSSAAGLNSSDYMETSEQVWEEMIRMAGAGMVEITMVIFSKDMQDGISHYSQCLAAGHWGYIGSLSNSSSQYDNANITDTNWFKW